MIRKERVGELKFIAKIVLIMVGAPIIGQILVFFATNNAIYGADQPPLYAVGISERLSIMFLSVLYFVFLVIGLVLSIPAYVAEWITGIDVGLWEW